MTGLELILSGPIPLTNLARRHVRVINRADEKQLPVITLARVYLAMYKAGEMVGTKVRERARVNNDAQQSSMPILLKMGLVATENKGHSKFWRAINYDLSELPDTPHLRHDVREVLCEAHKLYKTEQELGIRDADGNRTAPAITLKGNGVKRGEEVVRREIRLSASEAEALKKLGGSKWISDQVKNAMYNG